MKTDINRIVCVVAWIVCATFLLSGCTSLFKAATYGDIPMAEEELKKGASVDERDGYGWTPLMWAVYYEQLGMVEFLLKKGANVNAQSAEGYWNIPSASTSLIIAAFYGRADCVSILLKHGANRKLKNNAGYTALLYAKEYQFDNVVKLLQ